MDRKLASLALSVLLVAVFVGGYIGYTEMQKSHGTGTGLALQEQENSVLNDVQSGIINETETIEIGEMI
jgi:hypothetical protein